MSEFFSNSGISLTSPGFITAYQAPDGEPEDSGIALGAIAAYVGAGGEKAVLEGRVLRPGTGVVSSPVSKAVIGPGQSVDLFSNRLVLLAGERLQFRCSPPGLLDVMVSTLDFTANPLDSSLRPVEVFVAPGAAEGVGGDVGGILETDPVEVVATFPEAFVPEVPDIATDNVESEAVFGEVEVPTPDIMILDAAQAEAVFGEAEVDLDFLVYAQFLSPVTGGSLSENDRRYTKSGTGQDTVVAGEAKSSGQWYIEFEAVTDLTGRMVGLATGNSTTFPGNFATSIGVDSSSRYGSGVGTIGGVNSMPTITAGQVYGIAVDMDNRRMWVHVQGAWAGGSNPSTASDPILTWTQTGLSFRAANRPFDNGASIRIREASPIAIPAGYQIWN
jgi:hypothetical protein